MGLINYLSLCIANLGVDPLFSNLFFLALPAFFALSFLLVFVTCVLEAIVFPLLTKIKYANKFRAILLSIIPLNVKVFLVTYLFVTGCTNTQAIEINEIFISTGEQTEISVSKVVRFSIGNKDVIRHFYRPKQQKILIKGKKIGFSDLIIWEGKQKKIHHIYVISKKDQLSKIAMAESLKKMSLQMRTQGEFLYVEGTLENLEHFILMNKLQLQGHQNLILNVYLSKSLRNKLYAIAYQRLYEQNASEVSCEVLGLNITCLAKGIDPENRVISFLKDRFNIVVSFTPNGIQTKNFVARFKIIQIETSQNSKFKLGLDKISNNIRSLLDRSEFIENQFINIGNSKAKIKTLAEPLSTLVYGEEALIQLGGEIPFSQVTNNMSNTNWKFYGLKIKTQLKIHQGKRLIQYETELTSPNQNAISGSKGKSSLFADSEDYIKLFEVGYQIDIENQHYIPMLGEVPILKSLFSSEDGVESYKHIICYIKLEGK